MLPHFVGKLLASAGAHSGVDRIGFQIVRGHPGRLTERPDTHNERDQLPVCTGCGPREVGPRPPAASIDGRIRVAGESSIPITRKN